MNKKFSFIFLINIYSIQSTSVLHSFPQMTVYKFFQLVKKKAQRIKI